MKALLLQELLIRFFDEHLRQQRQVSPHTVLAYRDTFRLLLRFLKRTYHVCPATLELGGLAAERVLAFLAHLEQQRANSVRSRNARLAAIRSFAHYAEDMLGPDLPESIRRLLAIPIKRHTRPILGFLSRPEIQAILAATGESWTGRRDYLLFLLLYNTGARISEILALRVQDVLKTDAQYPGTAGKRTQAASRTFVASYSNPPSSLDQGEPRATRIAVAAQPLWTTADALRGRLAVAADPAASRRQDAFTRSAPHLSTYFPTHYGHALAPRWSCPRDYRPVARA